MVIRHNDEFKDFVMENDGAFIGKHVFQSLLKRREMEGDINLFNRFTIEPGAGFKIHQHDEGAEIYYILSGELWVGAPEEEQICKAGDITIANTGDTHHCLNKGTEPCSFLAIVLGEVGSWHIIEE